MSRLVLINGAPGTGKSTLARRYADEHPLTLALDIDVVRSLLGAWREHASDAGIMARRLAVAMIRVALADGHDVVVPQLLGRPEFIEQLAEVAATEQVPFAEIVVSTPVATAVRRFTERSAAATDDHQVAVNHDDPGELIDGYQRSIATVTSRRSATVIIDNDDGRGDQAYADLLTAIAQAQVPQRT